MFKPWHILVKIFLLKGISNHIIYITVIILGIIYRPVFYLKHDVSETWFSSRLQVEPLQVSPLGEKSYCLRTGSRSRDRE
jgi:hypothetical protein